MSGISALIQGHSKKKEGAHLTYPTQHTGAVDNWSLPVPESSTFQPLELLYKSLGFGCAV